MLSNNPGYRVDIKLRFGHNHRRNPMQRSRRENALILNKVLNYSHQCIHLPGVANISPILLSLVYTEPCGLNRVNNRLLR